MLTIDKFCSLFKRYLLEWGNHDKYQYYLRNTNMLDLIRDQVSTGSLGQHIIYTDFSAGQQRLAMYGLLNFFDFMYKQECIKNEIANMLDDFLTVYKLKEMFLNNIDLDYFINTKTLELETPPISIHEYIDSSLLHFYSPFSLIEFGASYREGKKLWMLANKDWRDYFVKILKLNEQRN